MSSPITLIKWSLIIASILTGLFLILILIPPYTGFMLEEDKTTGYMTITKLES